MREAQEKIIDAIDMFEQAIRAHDREDKWDAYVVAHLKIIASDVHAHLSRDTNPDDVIRQLLGREDEEDW